MIRCAAFALVLAASHEAVAVDLLLRGGQVYDGTRAPPRNVDVAIEGDRIVAVGQLADQPATRIIDASGLVVAPGFINMLSWAAESLEVDGRGLSDLKQGVTLEVFGEGKSPGPVKASKNQARQTLRSTMATLADSGLSLNIASLVGASTVRSYVMGDRAAPANPDEIIAMQALVDEAMRDGALGVGAALIYAPGAFATTDELIALAETAARYDGLFTAHLRSEGDRLLKALDEFISVVERTGVRGEVHHLKASGQANWPKLPQAIERIEIARNKGLDVSANIYAYVRGATGLDAAMPAWVQRGGTQAWIERLKDPAIRATVRQEMSTHPTDWENLLAHSGPDGALLVGFENPALAHYTGKTLAQVAALRQQDPLDTAIDLVIEDGSEVQVVYTLMAHDNLRTKLRTPWISFGSDARALATEKPFTNQSTHPRAYGNFARVLGRFVREERVLSLSDAIHRMTAMPAKRLGLEDRGCLAVGCFADVVVFDAAKITDNATYEAPHRYATGVRHVIVNGTPTILDGDHTGARAGRLITREPGSQTRD